MYGTLITSRLLPGHRKVQKNSWSRGIETNDMIHMGSDHRRVMAHYVITSPKKEVSKNAHRQKENQNSREHNEPRRWKTWSDEANKFEERYAEFERKIKHEAEIAATKAGDGWVFYIVAASRRSYRCWSRSITPLERRRKRRSCSEDAIWKICYGSLSSTTFEWRRTRRSHREFENVRMGDLLWKTQQHSIRMKTRTPQLQKQSKLKADSLLKQQQHVVVMTNAAAAASKEKSERTEVMSRSQEKNEKTNEGDDEIERLVEERRNIVKGDHHQLKELSNKFEKVHQRHKKNKTTRKDTSDAGGNQRHQKFIMHIIWKKKRSSRKWKTTKVIELRQEKECKCLRRIVQQVLCRKVGLEKKYKTFKTRKQEWTLRGTAVTKMWEMKCHSSRKMKYKRPLITSKKGWSKWHQRNWGRRHQDMRRNDERHDQTHLQRSVEARGLHTRKHGE